MRELDEKIFEAYSGSILSERKFDLGSGHKGHGITVWNRAKEVHGDYEHIAHIDSNRKIKWYLKKPPKDVVKYVENIAKGKNPNISATQSRKVFRENTESFIDDSTVKASILKDMQIATNDMIMKVIIPSMKKAEEKIVKKHKLSGDANMYIKNYGTAFIHDVFREMVGQQLVSSGNLKKRYF